MGIHELLVASDEIKRLVQKRAPVEELRNQGIITFRKESNYIYNRIADDRVIDLVNTMQNLFC